MQVPFLVRVNAEAPKLRLLAGIVLLSLHKPLEVAEVFANIDVMSNGKLIFGVGIGYRDVEFKAFDVPRKQAARRLEENLEAIKRLWTEEKVSMKGSHFELDEATCTIKTAATTAAADLDRRQCRCCDRTRSATDRRLVC